jgi:starch synthase (maltosyl-transferring)
MSPAQGFPSKSSIPLTVEDALTLPRIAIESVTPVVENGRYAAKAVVDQPVTIGAVIFADTHDQLAGALRWRYTTDDYWHRVPLTVLVNDHWEAQLTPSKTGFIEFFVDAWWDIYGTYCYELRKKFSAGVSVDLELREGELLVRAIAQRALGQAGGSSRSANTLNANISSANTFSANTLSLDKSGADSSGTDIYGADTSGAETFDSGTARDPGTAGHPGPTEAGIELAARIEQVLAQLAAAHTLEERVAVLLAPATAELMGSLEAHPHQTRSPLYVLDVERPLAQFASWYELFPRSVANEHRHGTFRDVIQRLPEISAMGFDVLYFPPIHPIGRRNRKGKNNSLTAGPDDPGSPYAIGSSDGGHDAIHPQLGTREDFRELVEAARQHHLEIALDFAIQCSPDHPWLQQHPGWFSWRPDGSIRYAENPPKKYEDIVNVDFYAAASQPDLWLALRDVVLGWVEQGVTLFRVDNPHTKPLPFWEWLIADIRHRHPEVIFLAEAFTKPAMMARLGKVGFSQSYTYFTWRNTKQELTSYFTELNQAPWRDCYRPNFFVNTPDINPHFLHNSGRPGFLIRAVLATMGSGLWGMYSGFEICEAEPVPGKEEYLNSEKYELRPRDYHAPGNITAEIAQFNRIRRLNPALQTHLGFAAYRADNEQIFYFGKRTPDRRNFILVAVSLDPFNAQEASFELPLWEFGLPDHAHLHGEDLMNGHTWTWYGKTQFMRLEPHQPFGIWRIRPVSDSIPS